MIDTAPAPEKILYGARQLADALGIGKNTVDLIRKASRIIGDPISRYATATDIKTWLARYPMFVARHWIGDQWKIHLAKYTAPSRPTGLAGKFDALPSKRDRPTP